MVEARHFKIKVDGDMRPGTEPASVAALTPVIDAALREGMRVSLSAQSDGGVKLEVVAAPTRTYSFEGELHPPGFRFDDTS